MLGKAMYEVFSEAHETLATDIDLNEPWLSHLDVRNHEQVEQVIAEFKPTLILHLAALTDLEYCELNRKDAWMTNALGTENLAIIAARKDIKLVYISTAGIFDGNQDEYTDFDKPAPISYYAKSKHYGEEFVLRHVPRHFVFRAGWMMGGGIEKDKKFLKKIYDQIKAGTKELFVVDDKLGTPTYTYDFARGILHVSATEWYGLYNQVCSGSCSRLDVAREFVKLLHLEDEVKVTAVSSDHFKREYFVHRPTSEKLINLKLNARGMNVMRDWKVCLAEYSTVFLEDLYKHRMHPKMHVSSKLQAMMDSTQLE
jgi:dTDP-4-dehydrorhamnose reductase